jgi:imidazolonepropionase-like amidohydrolase
MRAGWPCAVVERLLSARGLPGAPKAAEGTLALIGGRLVDGTGSVHDGVSILIRDGLISLVCDQRVRLEADRHLELGGRTVIPGLVDAHVHLSSVASVPEPGVRPYVQMAAARDTLAAGITTVRDVGSYGRELFALREAAGLGLVSAPRLLLCGQILSAPSLGAERFQGMYRVGRGVDELRAATREQVRQGADLIKVMSTGALTVPNEPLQPAQLVLEEIEVVVEEAHRLGVRVASHAEGLDGIRVSLQAGVDTVEHGEQLHRAPELLEQMAKRRIVLVPTLSVFHLVAEDSSGAFPLELVEQAKQLLEDAYTTVAAAREHGVPVAMGFDAEPHGANGLELVRLVEAGASPLEAIESGTAVAAEACGLDDVGRLTPGAVADLVVLDRDPLKDISALTDRRSIWLVLQDGRRVAGESEF